ncbi:unnamed protein product [Brugia timori]|uniref:PX domain-containing protein n=1 Tax=Brugia timori TaxID=42155 RepID=A0A0R3R1R1_9BILA|nr:unnamed protein product [Brugia timori]
MALLDLDNIVPRLEGNSMISIPHYKIKDGKYAVYVIKVTIDSTVWTIERRYSDFVAFDLQRFVDRKKSFLPPKKFIGNLVKLYHHFASSYMVVYMCNFILRVVGVYKLQDSFFRTSEERNVRIVICVREPAEGFESGYRWRKDEVL